MNTRIRDIYKQSVERCVEQYGNADGPVAWAWEEKFAELIIEECMQIALESSLVTNKSELAKVEAIRIRDKIAKRFDIKEKS